MANGQKATNYGIDFGCTIANTDVTRSLWIEENLGIEVKPWNTGFTTGYENCVRVIGFEAYARMSSEIYSPEWMARTPEIKGATLGIRKLSQLSNLYLLAEKGNGDVDVIRSWLKQHKLSRYFKQIVEVSGLVTAEQEMTRRSACKQFSLDAVVDDDESHLKGLVNGPSKRILFKNWVFWENFRVPEGVHLARNWKEVCERLDYAE